MIIKITQNAIETLSIVTDDFPSSLSSFKTVSDYTTSLLSILKEILLLANAEAFTTELDSPLKVVVFLLELKSIHKTTDISGLVSSKSLLGNWKPLMKDLRAFFSNLDSGDIVEDILNKWQQKALSSMSIKESLIKSCKILFSTVNSVGRIKTKSIFMRRNPIVIVDEATQVVEAELLIILQSKIASLTLVGDDKQLPATVFSQLAKEFGFEKSLFDRLKEEKIFSFLLSTQYRMKPEISRFPNTKFYAGSINDGENVLTTKYLKHWNRGDFSPVTFFSLCDSYEEKHLHSAYNEIEAGIVIGLVKEVLKLKNEKSADDVITIGIIAGYSSQIQYLCTMFTEIFGEPSEKSKTLFFVSNLVIDIKTIDGFQGQERDIIIFSLTKSNQRNEIGFMKCPRRLNVALTRAKYSLWLVGSDDTFGRSNSIWDQLISHYSINKNFVDVQTSPTLKGYYEIARSAYLKKKGMIDDGYSHNMVSNEWVSIEEIISKSDPGGSIVIYSIPFSMNKFEVMSLLSAVLHKEPYMNDEEIFNFEVFMIPSSSIIQTHCGKAVLTLPEQRHAKLLLEQFFDYGLVLEDGSILTFAANSANFMKAHPVRLDRVRRTPWREPTTLKIHEEFQKEVSNKIFEISNFKFVRELWDSSFSTEFELCDSLLIGFKCKPGQVFVRTPDIDISFLITDVITVLYDDLTHEIAFTLLCPPVFEIDPVIHQGCKMPEDEDERPRKFRKSEINEKHKNSAYCTKNIVVRFHSFDNFNKFLDLSQKMQMVNSNQSDIVVVKKNLYSKFALGKVKRYLSELPISIAFQCERIIRNGILDPIELLSLSDRISSLRKNVRGADIMTFFYHELISADDIFVCFDEILKKFENKSLDTTEIYKNSFKCLTVCVTPSSFTLGGPNLNPTNRIIRKYSKYQEFFMKVTFTDEKNVILKFDKSVDKKLYLEERVGSILKDGFEIAGRKYEFLGYSNSGLREHSVYFITPFVDDNGVKINASVIHCTIGDFSKEKYYPARYGARLAQAFSSTSKSFTLEKDHLKKVPDIFNDKHENFTDGVGQVSKSLAKAIWEKLPKSKKGGTVSCPSTFQFRLGGMKGMVVVNTDLKGKKVLLYRDSMSKFISTSLDFEVAQAFTKANRCYLNRPLIKILEDLKVPDRVFLDLQQTAVSKLNAAHNSIDAAFDMFRSHSIGSSFRIASILGGIKDILGLDFGKEWDGHFLKYAVELGIVHVLREIKQRARIPVPESYNLVGVADEWNYLYDGEVYICIWDEAKNESKYLEGPVCITRSPCLHPGDVQMAIAVGELPEKYKEGYGLRNVKNCVVFSTNTMPYAEEKAKKGERKKPPIYPRPLPSKLAGGDLVSFFSCFINIKDGDEFNIIMFTPMLPKKMYFIHFLLTSLNRSEPASYPPVEKLNIEDRYVQISDICDFIVHYIHADVIGLVSNRHLLVADLSPLGVFDPICIKLAELASLAVDFAKSGIPVSTDILDTLKFPGARPDFLIDKSVDSGIERRAARKSKKILGQLFRAIHIPKLDDFTERMFVGDETLLQKDPISNALKEKFNLSFEIKKRYRRYGDKLITTFSNELLNIGRINNFSGYDDDILTEAECFVATNNDIMNNNIRKQINENLKSQTSELVERTLMDLKMESETQIVIVGGKEELIDRAWGVWITGMTMEERPYGAFSCMFVALNVLFELLDPKEKK